jgi:hypothetical protein
MLVDIREKTPLYRFEPRHVQDCSLRSVIAHRSLAGSALFCQFRWAHDLLAGQADGDRLRARSSSALLQFVDGGRGD